MDDDCKDFKKLKPQQQLYKPGSGPLRRSRYGLDSKMESYDLDNSTKGRDKAHYGSQHSVNGEDVNATSRDSANSRYRKPEQQLYVPRSGDSCIDIDKRSKSSFKCDNSSQYGNRQKSNKQDNHGAGTTGSYNRDTSGRDFHHKDGPNDVNFNRHYRQGSEARSMSPMQVMHDQKSLDRNRDSRSMETWAGRHKSSSGGKPPSGRRNSAGFSSDPRPKHMINLDNLPPRFRKKYLESTGHQSFDSVDQLNKDHYSSNDMSQSHYNQGQFYSSNNPNWSQTLPSRGRGRLRDNENFDREKFINSYIKNYEVQNSRRSTPSNSYVNLYDSTVNESSSLSEKLDSLKSEYESQKNANNAQKNGLNSNEMQHSDKESEEKVESSENQNDSESISHLSTNLSDMTNLDWTEEVEKNIKLDDVCNSSASFSQSESFSHKKPSHQETKDVESREGKRNNRSRRRDRRSSSRGHKNSEKKNPNRKDSNVSVPYEPERNRKDSNVSIQYETPSYGLKQRERERRDSHRSNRSSTIGNSRDDLDRWRSLRSYSREQSSERRIVSQCNSRDTSANRAASPKDNDGFRVPSSTAKSWSTANQKRSNGPAQPVNGRTPSAERKSPPGAEHEGGGRRSRKRFVRRRRNAENMQPAAHAHTHTHAHPHTHPQPHAHAHAPAAQPPAPASVNWRDEIIESKKQHHDRSEGTHQRNRLNSILSDKSVSESCSQPGLIILPQSSMSHFQKDQCRGGSGETQKTLFDHHNPSKPIIVQTTPSKHDMRMERGVKESCRYSCAGEGSRGARHTALLQTVERADAVLRTHTLRGPLALAADWPEVADTRKFLHGALQKLLMSDLKFCQADNIEQQFWKILYYHFIENLRKSIAQVTPEEKPQVVKLINTIIDEGNIFFENLVQMLEKTYKFNTEDYLNDNHVLPPKGLGYVGLALISVQKLYVFLGDLARYKEQVNESNNYAKSKFWYAKAQQINPKNGRPYNQLAILAIYARRKLDAVYYYMRSLMSSNPFQSARESLLSLFDENRKKYEAAERKRRAAAEQRADGGEGARGAGGAAGTGAAGAGGAGGGSGAGGLRREVWVRPSGHRTTTLRHARRDSFNNITPVELNKNFITSYLHVHGKLITKIGMESFHGCACQMLRQFRSLLHRSPLPTPAPRLLQLTALNMFAVEATAHAKGHSGAGRSPWLECALGVSLLMFGALLERCCALLPEPAHTQQHADALLLLPAIKVWSDWMLCHSSIWNPPPSFDNFEIESENDPWDWLAKLMNILEALDDKSIEFESEAKEGCSAVRLPEDASLAGFTPLMYMEPAHARVAPPAALAPHAAEHALRTRKLLFFGTEYLVGVDPPVLKLEYPSGEQPRYVSAVQASPAAYPPLHHLSEDSEVEEPVSGAPSGPTSLSEAADAPDDTTRDLLRRREMLESRKATIEKRRQRMQEMLSTGWVSVEVEVRPRWLVPDTNCFIDHLSLLQAVATAPANPYNLAVPLVVVTELEGLRKCSRVGAKARDALAWVCGAGGGGGGGAGAGGGGGGGGGTVRLATARGSLLTSRTFTAEQDEGRATNDDRVLATALNLQANLAADTAEAREEGGGCVRVVVLVTDDRNLRVKALAAELPARDLLSFAHWAGLLTDTTAKSSTDIQSPDV